MRTRKMLSASLALCAVTLFSLLFMPAISAQETRRVTGTLSYSDPISGKMFYKLAYWLTGYPNHLIDFGCYFYIYGSPLAQEWSVQVTINEKWTWWIFSGWSQSGDWQRIVADGTTQPTLQSNGYVFWNVQTIYAGTYYWHITFVDLKTTEIKQYQIIVQAQYVSWVWQYPTSATYYWDL